MTTFRASLAILALLVPIVAANPLLHSPLAFALPQYGLKTQSGSSSSFVGAPPLTMRCDQKRGGLGSLQRSNRRRKVPRGQVRMDFGSDGFLGVGAPEIVVICVVGYFLLGPTELYRLAKEVGKLVTQLRATATEASTAFSTTMEQQLAIGEITDAANDLQDAFRPFTGEGRNARMGAGLASTAALKKTPQDETSQAEDLKEAPMPDFDAWSEAAAAAEAGAPMGAPAAEGVESDEAASSYPSELEAPQGPVPFGTSFGSTSENKFDSQLSGDWNAQVMAGQGPWGDSNPFVGGPVTENDVAAALAAPFREALELAQGDEELLEMLGGLEVERLAEMGRLREEYEAKLAAVAGEFELRGGVVKEWGVKKAAIEAKMAASSASSAVGSLV